jgi:hypothetical protein
VGNALFGSNIKGFSERIPRQNSALDANGELHNTLQCFKISEWGRGVWLFATFVD